MSSPLNPLPVWADVALIPLINVAAAFIISGLVVLAIGENPIEAVQILVGGAHAVRPADADARARGHGDAKRRQPAPKRHFHLGTIEAIGVPSVPQSSLIGLNTPKSAVHRASDA